MDTEMPRDPYILLSWTNTKLRDHYPTLEAMCDDLNLDASELTARLEAAGFSYDAELNRFG